MSRIAVTDEPLSVLVARRMEVLGITSGRQLAARCGFAKDTARHVLSGQRNSDESTLRALAEGLSLPLSMVRRAAGRPPGEQLPFVLPPVFDQLDDSQRQLLVSMGYALLRVRNNHRTAQHHHDGADIADNDTTLRVLPRLAGRTRDPDDPRPTRG